MQFLRSPLYFHTSSSGGQLSQTHLGYCSALYKSILPKIYSQPLPRTSLTASLFSLSLLLPFFSIPFSIAAFKGFSSCLLGGVAPSLPSGTGEEGIRSFPCGTSLLPWEIPGDILESQTPSWVIPMLTGGGREQTQPRRGKSTKFKLSLFSCGWWGAGAVLWERKGGIKLSFPPCLSPALRSGCNKPTPVGVARLPAKPRCPWARAAGGVGREKPT